MFFRKKNRTPLRNAIEYFYKKEYYQPCQINIKHKNIIIMQIFYSWSFREINEITKFNHFAILFDINLPDEIINSLQLNIQKSIEGKTMVLIEKNKNKLEKISLIILGLLFEYRQYDDIIGFEVQISSPAGASKIDR